MLKIQGCFVYDLVIIVYLFNLFAVYERTLISFNAMPKELHYKQFVHRIAKGIVNLTVGTLTRQSTHDRFNAVIAL